MCRGDVTGPLLALGFDGESRKYVGKAIRCDILYCWLATGNKGNLMDYMLFFPEQILELEQENKWWQAAQLVYGEWEKNPSNLSALLCAATQLWYTCLVMEYNDHSPIQLQNIEAVPREWLYSKYLSVMEYGFKNFKDDANFNAYAGYMIKIRPERLPGPQDYLAWEEKGNAMIRYAHAIDPGNLFAEAMYLNVEHTAPITKYQESCKKIWKENSPEKWGNSAVQRYFSRILNGKT